MALFALTGILSLGAGLGIGSLLPISSSKPRIVPSQKVNSQVTAIPLPSLPPTKIRKKSPQIQLQGGGNGHTLNFDEFDKSLMKMLQNQPTKFSTIHASVAYDSNYYSPPREPPFVPVKKHPLHATERAAEVPRESLQNVEHPAKKSQKQPQQHQNNLNTSWF
jgi:hypothetical protein